MEVLLIRFYIKKKNVKFKPLWNSYLHRQGTISSDGMIARQAGLGLDKDDSSALNNKYLEN